MENYKSRYSEEYRLNEYNKIIKKYPNKVPVIVCKSEYCTLDNIDKEKFLVPSDMTIGQFIYVIRKRINIESHQALFITINNSLQGSNKLMQEIYESNKDKDGFLYIKYTSENTFG